MRTPTQALTRIRRGRAGAMTLVAGLSCAALVASMAAPASADTSTDALAKIVPLTDYNPVLRTIPGLPGDDFSYLTHEVFWSVVGVRSPIDANVNLSLYDLARHQTVLAQSKQGLGIVDFIAVDSNHRPPDTLYPLVSPVRGGGKYTIQVAQAEDILDEDVETITMRTNDVVVIRDSFLLAGTAYEISAVPANGTQNASLFIMSSNPSFPLTWVKSRNAADASADLAVAGAPETMTFTPTISDWYGVVLVNESGSGAYTLTRTTP